MKNNDKRKHRISLTLSPHFTLYSGGTRQWEEKVQTSGKSFPITWLCLHLAVRSPTCRSDATSSQV